MPAITLPDGSVRRYDHPVSPRDIAASIGPGLAKAALAAKVDGKLVDTSEVIDRDAAVAIVTDKDPEGLDVIRHSTAHLLAYAVKELFPDAQVTIGPVIEDGFYYDFSFKRPFTPEDLVAIEGKMAELAKKDEPVTRKLIPRDDAVAYFKSLGRALQGRDHRVDPVERAHFALHRGQVHRPLPRPARAVHRQAPRLQADEARRRVLARRLEERDAAADLRHGVGEERGPGRLPATDSRKPRSATIASSGGSSISSICRTKRRGWCSGIRRAGRCGNRSSSTCAASTRTTATRKCARPMILERCCGNARATGRTSRRTCSRPSRRSTTTR